MKKLFNEQDASSSYKIHDHPSKAMKVKDVLGRLQIKAEDKELLLQLIAQSKRQQGEIIETNSVLKKMLELQISSVQQLQGEITAENAK